MTTLFGLFYFLMKRTKSFLIFIYRVDFENAVPLSLFEFRDVISKSDQ